MSWRRALAIGVATGLLSGLLGVGGGIVLVPALVASGFVRHQANANSLAAIWLVALAGAATFSLAGEVRWGVGVALGVGGLVGAAIGAQIMKGLSARALALIFGLVLLLTGLRMAIGGDADFALLALAGPGRVAVEVAIGVLAGLASGLAGIGGGVLMVPAMVLLLGLSPHTAEGTSLVAILFTATSGTIVNARNGLVKWKLVAWLGVIGAATAPVAALLAQRIAADQLARIFGLFAVAVAIRTIVKSRADRPSPA